MRIVIDIPSPWTWVRRVWRRFWGMRAYRRLERASIPDGTRVRLICPDRCRDRHLGIWTTSWTPRRIGGPCPWDEPDDYRLTRESDGETVYATRESMQIL